MLRMPAKGITFFAKIIFCRTGAYDMITTIKTNQMMLESKDADWQKKIEALLSGKITRDEYFEWKIIWPDSKVEKQEREEKK